MRIVGAAVLLFCISPAFAHHSFSAEYKITSPMTLKGEITAIEWTNPHVFLLVSVKDSSGASQVWHVEGGAISALKQIGWTADMLRRLVTSHDTVVVTGYRGRNGVTPPLSEAWGKQIELPDGRVLPFN